MELKINSNTVLVFDLDDTLYSEREFLISAFRTISSLYKKHDDYIFYKMMELFEKKENVFLFLVNSFPNIAQIKDLSKYYREHHPVLSLSYDTKMFLSKVKEVGCKTGLLTDGRSITQRNKLESLGLIDYFDMVIISEEFGSEKPDMRNYKVFQSLIKKGNYIFFGDNPKKDFVTPNKLGWLTICILDNGKNIHKQDFRLSKVYLPQICINGYNELEIKYEG